MSSAKQLKENSNTVTATDILSLFQIINHFHPVTNPEIEIFFRKHLTRAFFRKGKLLLKAGEVCDYVYFIKKGAVRGYIREGVKDITTWITADGEMVTSISGLDSREAAIDNMQAIEDSELLALSYTALQTLYDKFPEFNIVVRKLLQKYYRDAEGRAFIARLTNAETKYKHFLMNHNHLANRVPLKYIASFLGITLETLSRVRKRMSQSS
jgi:CRP-like cAMP-binding protein